LAKVFEADQQFEGLNFHNRRSEAQPAVMKMQPF
jgi:hypothetical protein